MKKKVVVVEVVKRIFFVDIKVVNRKIVWLVNFGILVWFSLKVFVVI